MRKILLFLIFTVLLVNYAQAQMSVDYSCEDSNSLLNQVYDCYTEYSDTNRSKWHCAEVYHEFLVDFYPNCRELVSDFNLFYPPIFGETNTLKTFYKFADEEFLKRITDNIRKDSFQNHQQAFVLEEQRLALLTACRENSFLKDPIVSQLEFVEKRQTILDDYIVLLSKSEIKVKNTKTSMDINYNLALIGARYGGLIGKELVSWDSRLGNSKKAFLYAIECGRTNPTSSYKKNTECYYYAYQIIGEFSNQVIDEDVSSVLFKQKIADYYLEISKFLSKHKTDFDQNHLLPLIAESAGTATKNAALNTGCFGETYRAEDCEKTNFYLREALIQFEGAGNIEEHTSTLFYYFIALKKLEIIKRAVMPSKFINYILPKIVVSEIFLLFFLIGVILFILSILSNKVAYYFHNIYNKTFIKKQGERFLEDIRKPNFFVIAIITLWIGTTFAFSLYSDMGAQVQNISQITDLSIRNEILLNTSQLQDAVSYSIIFFALWNYMSVFLIFAFVIWILSFFDGFDNLIFPLEFLATVIMMATTIPIAAVYWGDDLLVHILGIPLSVVFFYIVFLAVAWANSKFKHNLYKSKSSDTYHKQNCKFVLKNPASFESISYLETIKKELKPCKTCFSK